MTGAKGKLYFTQWHLTALSKVTCDSRAVCQHQLHGCSVRSLSASQPSVCHRVSAVTLSSMHESQLWEPNVSPDITSMGREQVSLSENRSPL